MNADTGHSFSHDQIHIKGKAIPVQARAGPEGARRLRVPDFEIIGTQRWIRLSALPTNHLYPPGIIPGTHLLETASTPGPQSGRKDYVNEKFQ